MEIYISRGGQSYGPYPLDQVRAWLASGQLHPNDLACYTGASNWVSLSSLLMMADGTSHQLPSSLVAKEFGEVNVTRKRDATEVLFTILMEPQGADSEGWQTGV